MNLLGLRTVADGTAGDRCAGGSVLAEQTYSYDVRNRMTATVQKVRSPDTGSMVSREQAFDYNNDGTLASFTHDGKSTTYTHTTSGAGWLEQIDDWAGHASTYDYFDSGAPDTVTRGANVTGGHTYLPDGSLGSLSWTHATTAIRSHTGLGYDLGGMLTSEDVLMADGTRQTGTAGFDHGCHVRRPREVRTEGAAPRRQRCQPVRFAGVDVETESRWSQPRSGAAVERHGR